MKAISEFECQLISGGQEEEINAPAPVAALSPNCNLMLPIANELTVQHFIGGRTANAIIHAYCNEADFDLIKEMVEKNQQQG